MRPRDRYRKIARGVWTPRARALEAQIRDLQPGDLAFAVAFVVATIAEGHGAILIHDSGADVVQIAGVRLDDEIADALEARGYDLPAAVDWLRGALLEADVAWAAWAIGRLERTAESRQTLEYLAGPDGVAWDLARHRAIGVVVGDGLVRL